MDSRPELIITGGELSGRRYKLTDGSLRLGRSSSNDINILDEELSRNHCLFEAYGDSGIRITDLASANGTYLNGELIGSDPEELKAGDEIRVGNTTIIVVNADDSLPENIDLGLGDAAENLKNPKPEKSSARSVKATVLLWSIVALLVAAASFILFFTENGEKEEPISSISSKIDNSKILEVFYEVVEADSNSIYRYEFKVDGGDEMRVRVDDVPMENRHHVKKKTMSDESAAELARILDHSKLQGFEPEYAGVQPDPPALKKQHLKVVYSADVKEILVQNSPMPESLERIVKELEAFSKNELGIWAIQYSREKLIALAEEAVAVGNAKWEDRSVQYGNLYDSIKSYKEAIFYLETLSPKPECYEMARTGLEKAKSEMEKAYSEQRFKADRALNLGHWDVAVGELRILMEMIPDRGDSRNRDAREKLISAEKQLKRGRAK